jgi:drug/metabolite transporter (DMT)-like permease
LVAAQRATNTDPPCLPRTVSLPAKQRRIRMPANGNRYDSFDALVAAALVFSWASGFVVPRFFGPYVAPLTFVAARNVAALAALSGVAYVGRHRWPRHWNERLGLIWAGALFQGVFLMAGYWAIAQGLPVATAALIGGLQPALTALFAAAMLGESISLAQIGGMALGLAGVALVISPKLGSADAGMSAGLAAVCLLGVGCAAYGSVYQKRFEGAGDNWTRTALIFIGAAVPPVLFAPMLERLEFQWSLELVLVYLWSVFALSIGATMAFLYLIGRGKAARTASLLYLVPPLSAAMAYFGFGEHIHMVQVAGFVVAAAGVYVVQARPQQRGTAESRPR